MDRPRRRPSEFDCYLGGGSAAPRFYAPELDGLRSIAALLVFVSHAPALPWKAAALVQANGCVGVDLFLCISVYLITRLILIEQHATGSFSLSSFFARRALRIWPLYLGFATLACLWSAAAGKVSVQESFAWWVAHLSFSANVLTAISGWSPVLYSGHLWTLALEEQAYLLLALLMVVVIASAPRMRTVALVCLGSIGMLMLARLSLLLGGASGGFIYVLPARGDALILGALAAIAADREILRPRAWMLFAGIALLSTTALFPPFNERSWFQVFGYAMTATAAAAIVSGSQAPVFARGLLVASPMRYLGKISYGIYVFHVAAIAVAVKLGSWWFPSRSVQLLLAMLITVAAASASYHWFERPFLKLKRRFQIVRSRPI